MPKITTIPATKCRSASEVASRQNLRKVAAYARVSTDYEEQVTSYKAQIDYYTRYIQNNPSWQFAGVYTDEGISATSTKHRAGFNRMVEDALNGKIDLIITKSVSRFARNTVDSLTTVRKLKEANVEVFFEKENIYTMDSKGELLITIMSSLSQEESRSISENVTWGQRKRMADGKVTLPYKNFLGYKRGEDGFPEIVEEEAEIVRQIYRMFISGKSPHQIAKHLTQQGIPTPARKKTWASRTVESILTNEKYKGDALLQKRFTVDFLTKKQKLNEGEVPQYYVSQSHPYIIEPEEFDLVQAEMMKRKNQSHIGAFSSKIICGDCGSFYGSKVWHSNSKYRRVIWQCNNKFKNESNCTTPHLYEAEIQKAFVTAFSMFFRRKSVVIRNCEMVLEQLELPQSDYNELQDRLELVSIKLERHIKENTDGNYDDEFTELGEQYEELSSQLESLEEQQIERKGRIAQIKEMLKALRKEEIEYDDALWNCLVESLTVFHDGSMVFEFCDGSEVKI